MRAKINLAQQNQASTLPDRALFAHLSSVTPHVKSGKTRILPFNGAPEIAHPAKSADPTLYNVSINSKETQMQKYIASYEDAAKTEAAAKALGWDGDEGLLDFFNGSIPAARQEFVDKDAAERWLIAQLKAGKSLFGCGDIDVYQQPKRRCRYCTCDGWIKVQSFLADNSGVTEERELSEECAD